MYVCNFPFSVNCCSKDYPCLHQVGDFWFTPLNQHGSFASNTFSFNNSCTRHHHCNQCDDRNKLKQTLEEVDFLKVLYFFFWPRGWLGPLKRTFYTSLAQIHHSRQSICQSFFAREFFIGHFATSFVIVLAITYTSFCYYLLSFTQGQLGASLWRKMQNLKWVWPPSYFKVHWR